MGSRQRREKHKARRQLSRPRARDELDEDDLESASVRLDVLGSPLRRVPRLLLRYFPELAADYEHEMIGDGTSHEDEGRHVVYSLQTLERTCG